MAESLPVVRILSFEGPFDLLLELVQAKKLDITDISLAEVTRDFLEHLQHTPLPTTGRTHFLAVAATLLLCKLRAVTDSLEPAEELEVQQLTERLVLYKQYQQKARILRQRWNTHMLFSAPERFTVSPTLPPLSCAAVQEAHTRSQRREEVPTPLRRHLRPARMSVATCQALITERLNRLPVTTLEELLVEPDTYTRAVTFLTLMELSRQGRVELQQPAPFSSITIQAL